MECALVKLSVKAIAQNANQIVTKKKEGEKTNFDPKSEIEFLAAGARVTQIAI